MTEKKIIGVIADTHGLFDPKLPAVFSRVEHILHAGDIGHLEVLEQLRKLAPVTAISGNIDEGSVPADLEPERVVQLYGVRIFMIHVLGDPQRLSLSMRQRLDGIRPNVVLFGHSHRPFLKESGGILFFNPGSAGPKRFSLPRSAGLLEIDKGTYRGEIVEL